MWAVIGRFFLSKLFAWLLVGGIVGGAIFWVEREKTRAFDRGVEATEKKAADALNRMEARLREALKKNETLSDPELDCLLRRLRQPNAAC